MNKDLCVNNSFARMLFFHCFSHIVTTMKTQYIKETIYQDLKRAQVKKL